MGGVAFVSPLFLRLFKFVEASISLDCSLSVFFFLVYFLPDFLISVGGCDEGCDEGCVDVAGSAVSVIYVAVVALVVTSIIL